MPAPVRLAMPAPSSRLHAAALSTMSRAVGGQDHRAGGERVLAVSLRSGLEVVQCRGADIPMLVARGFADVGLTGYDMIVERVVGAGDRLDVRSLAPSRASLVCLVTVPGRRPIKLLYTEYPHLTRLWARSTLTFHDVRAVRLHGSAEGLVAVDGHSGGVVLVTTGETLKANGLVVVCPIIATDLCVVRRDGAVSTVGSLVIEELPRLTMPQFVDADSAV